MEEKYTVDQGRVIKAVEAITHAMECNGINKLEGAVAMRAILSQLAREGFDVRSEERAP